MTKDKHKNCVSLAIRLMNQCVKLCGCTSRQRKITWHSRNITKMCFDQLDIWTPFVFQDHKNMFGPTESLEAIGLLWSIAKIHAVKKCYGKTHWEKDNSKLVW